MPVYCVTLSQTPERTAIAAAHFRRRGVDAKMFQGVHGLTWGVGTEQWFGDRRDAGDWKIPPGHVGLNLSHWMLWTHLLHSGVREALILEDDAVLCRDFLAEFDKTMAKLPADWQLWYVGTFDMDGRKRAVINDRLIKVNGYVWGNHAYAVRRSALPVLLAEMQSCRDHIDVQMSEMVLPKINWYASWPNLARQRTADGQWQGCCHQPYSPPQSADRQTAIEVSQELQGWCPPEKSGAIYDSITELATKFTEPLRCVELGVWGGMSLVPAAMALRDTDRGHVTGIDPYTKAAAIEGLGTQGDEGRHREAWASGKYGEYLAARDDCLQEIKASSLGAHCSLLTVMPDEVAGGWDKLHYLHVDDSHSEVTSCRNVSTWLPKVVPGGLVVLDDCCWPTVQAARRLVQHDCIVREDLSDQSPGRRWEVYQK